jgi:DNA-binding MarR family transcriptional regulator
VDVNTATRLENAGALARQRETADARLVRLYRTDWARAVQQPIEDARRRLEHRATATLTSEERRHHRSALTKIVTELIKEASAGESGSELS